MDLKRKSYLGVTEVGRVDDTPGVVTTPSSSGDECKRKRKSHLGVTEVGRVDDTPGVVTTPSSSGDECKRKRKERELAYAAHRSAMGSRRGEGGAGKLTITLHHPG